MATKDILAKGVVRILTGFIVGFIALYAVLAGGLPLFIIFTGIILLVGQEYSNIIKAKGLIPQQTLILISSFLLMLFASLLKYQYILPTITICTIIAFVYVVLKNQKPYIANISTTILGITYCGWLACHVFLLRNLGVENFYLTETGSPLGLDCTLLLLFTVVATDVGGWYFGSRFGKNPLCPEISPKKTKEGAIYGTIFAIAIATFVGLFLKMPLYHSIIAGLIMAISAQFGDLAESLLKRDSGVKDSSQALPGHGGFLDRLDGYLFAAPMAYYYFKIFVLNTQYNIEPILSWTKIISFLGF